MKRLPLLPLPCRPAQPRRLRQQGSSSDAGGSSARRLRSRRRPPVTTTSAGAASLGAGHRAAHRPGLGHDRLGRLPENALLADIYGDAMAAKGVKVSEEAQHRRARRLHRRAQGRLDRRGAGVHRLDPVLPRPQGHGQDAGRRLHGAQTAAAIGASCGVSKSSPRPRTATRSPSPRRPRPSTTSPRSVTSRAVASEADPRAPGAVQDPRRRHPGAEDRLRRHVRHLHAAHRRRRHGHGRRAEERQRRRGRHLLHRPVDPRRTTSCRSRTTKSMFAAQNIVPLFAQKVLTQPMIEAACNAVSAKLDTTDPANLVVAGRGRQGPGRVAKAWL